jgi:hypothetical protein
MGRNPFITVWGETKRAKEWLSDERCKVGVVDTLVCRIAKYGWTTEEAITRPAISHTDTSNIVFSKGIKFGFLIVKADIELIDNKRMVLCECVCGQDKHFRVSSLLNEGTQSCGCKTGYLIGQKIKTHGLSRSYNGGKHPLYRSWDNMRGRCLNEKIECYKNYGGRGIKLFKEWENFETFYTWAINNGFEIGLTIERIDNDGDYCPSNCKWITLSEQQKNKRTVHKILAFGEIKCVQDWAKDERCKVSPTTLRIRLKNNWNPETAITKCPTRVKVP